MTEWLLRRLASHINSSKPSPQHHRHRGVLVIARAHAAALEDLVLGNPVERLLEHVAAVGLEHDAFARPPAPRIHRRMEALGELHLVVVGVELRPQIDVALGAAQRLEILLHVLHVRIAVDHGADHEGGVDDLAISLLFGEVIRAAEQGGGLRLAVEERLHAAEQHALVIRQLDRVACHVGFQRLDGGVVAAGLEADRNRHTCKIGRRLDGRIRPDENARRRHRIGIREQLGVAARGRDVHGPVAGAGDVGLPPLLDALERAAGALRHVVRAVRRADEFPELVVEPLSAKIALLFRHPFLQPEMRFDLELGHAFAPERCFALLFSQS